MANPQQPELARSQHNAVVPAPPDAGPAPTKRTGARTGPVPPENQPGHHPEVDQDKPTGPPSRKAAKRSRKTAAQRSDEVRGAASSERDDTTQPAPSQIDDRLEGVRRFAFAFEPAMAPFAAAVGVTPWTAHVDVGDGRLLVRFGAWSLDAPLDDIVDVARTGPYSLVKVAGPPRLSLKDRGLTFATNRTRGVCVRFARPVKGIEPSGVLRHPAVTLTVDEIDEFEALLRPSHGNRGL